MKKKRVMDAIWSQRISKRLEVLNMPQKDLAHACDVSEGSVSQWIYGKGGKASEPSAASLIKLARALGVSTDYLLGITDVPTIDTDLRAVCKYAGLSPKAVKALRGYATSWDKGKQILNKALECGSLYDLFSCLALSIASKAETKKSEKLSGQKGIHKWLVDVRDAASLEFICEKYARKLISSISKEELLQFSKEWENELTNDEKILKMRTLVRDIAMADEAP